MFTEPVAQQSLALLQEIELKLVIADGVDWGAQVPPPSDVARIKPPGFGACAVVSPTAQQCNASAQSTALRSPVTGGSTWAAQCPPPSTVSSIAGRRKKSKGSPKELSKPTSRQCCVLVQEMEFTPASPVVWASQPGDFAAAEAGAEQPRVRDVTPRITRTATNETGARCLAPTRVEAVSE
jgi:hypothetical protein